MKKIFAFFAVAALFAGCQKDIVDDTPVARTLSAPLTLAVGESTTRVFDDELKWSWENSDEIAGYQNAGDKTRNTLSLKEGNKFHCNEFAYSTDAAADFHFFYANETTEGELTAVQDGTWRPVLVGTARNTTLDAIETVSMEHLSAALQVTLYDSDRTNTIDITSATLSSASNFVGKWTVKDDLSYEQSLDGKVITVDLTTPSPTVVFNMPAGTFAADELTLTLTTESNIAFTRKLPAQTFVAGKRNRINIAMPKMAYLPTGETIRDAIPDEATSVNFVVNSDIEDGDVLADVEYPIYIVINDEIEDEIAIEFHTSADKFMANEDCSNMFNGKENLQQIDLANVDTSNVTNMSNMFSECWALTSLDVSGFNTAKVTNMSGMFYGCWALTSLDVSGFNTANVTNMSKMFGCFVLTSLDVSGFNTEKVTDMSYMFQCCSSLTLLDVSGFNTTNVTDMSYMFSECKALTSLDVSGFNTAKVKDMKGMFKLCLSLKQIDVSRFDTANVTNMYCMFYGCWALTSLDVSGFNTAKVENMAGMFMSCDQLVTLRLGNLKTENVTTMNDMFSYCHMLTELNLSSFNTAKVIDMEGMFSFCAALTKLDLSGFNTENVTNMRQMFYRCKALEKLDLSNFTFDLNPDVGSIFKEVGNNLTDGKKTQIKVSADGYGYLNGKTLGEGNYEIVDPTNNQ